MRIVDGFVAGGQYGHLSQRLHNSRGSSACQAYSSLSVPALYKKVHNGVCDMIDKANPLRKLLLLNALAMGSARARSHQGYRAPLGPIKRLQYNVLDRLVLSKIRDIFGGRLRFGCVGGAACSIEVINFMDSLDISICKGYGLTKTSPIITVNIPTNRLPGSTGLMLTPKMSVRRHRVIEAYEDVISNLYGEAPLAEGFGENLAASSCQAV